MSKSLNHINMKQINFYSICIAFSVAALAFGCDDLLDESPKAQEQDFLQNLSPGLLEQTITGVYEPLTRSRGRLWESTVGLGLELMAEYADGGPSQANWSNYANVMNNPNNLSQPWSTLYEAIGRANLLIASLDADKNLSQDVKDRGYGEARFVRALCYYFAVRTWGKVPMRLTPIKNTSETALALSSVDEIYGQILEDLLFAEGVLPTTVPSAKAGRATKGAAKVMLADVYLTMGDFTNARTKAKEVMDNKATYGYDLLTSFETLYSPVLPTNAEDVFSLKFSQFIDQGSFLASYYADDRAAQAGLSVTGLRFGGAVGKAPLITGWDKKDLRRRMNIYDSIVINGVRVKANLVTGVDYFFGKYKDPGAPQDTGNGNDFYLYRYADVLLIFAEAENQLNGPTPEAYEAVNKIRRRGYGVDINTPSALADFQAGLTQTKFDSLVFRERGYEFMAEAKRWFDLVRTGRAETYIGAVNSTRKPVPTRLLFALPDVELQNNPLANE
jgi:hypothetical protein